MRRSKKGVSFELRALSCKLIKQLSNILKAAILFTIHHSPFTINYSPLKTRSLQLIVCSLLFTACSFISSFAQQTNEAVQQGNEAYKNGEYNAAVKGYSKALQTDKKNTAAWFNLGNALQKTMKPENAAKNYDEAINSTASDDLRSKAYYNKALAMLQQKNLQSAINSLKQSLRLTPADNDARENLQKALNEQKKQQQEQQQQQNQKQNNNQQQQQQKQQKQQKMMDKQMMEQKFQELRNQEKELQKQLQQQKASTQQQEKDW